jgi:hypothetical protein
MPTHNGSRLTLRARLTLLSRCALSALVLIGVGLGSSGAIAHTAAAAFSDWCAE